MGLNKKLWIILLAFTFHWQSAFGIKFRVVSDEGNTVIETETEEPRDNILTNKPNSDGTPTPNEDASGTSEDVELELPSNNGETAPISSASSSSSSEESEQLAILMRSTTTAADTSTTTTPSTPGQKKKLQMLAKAQVGRLFKPKNATKGNSVFVKTSQRGHKGFRVKEKRQDADAASGGDAAAAPGAPAIPSGPRPFNVVRARPSDLVDPDSYNFFQFRPTNKLAWLWLSHGRRLGGRIDLLGKDNGNDDDDNDPSNLYDWEFRRYDRACLYVEFQKQKSDAVIPIIPEELKRITDAQNEILARKFLDWQFVNKESHEAIALQDQGDKHPLYKTYKFLALTMELFRDKICRNASSYAVAVSHTAPPGAVARALSTANTVDTKLLPKAFVDDLFRLFLALREITLTKNLPDYANELDEEEVYKEVLEKCKSEEENINWFSHSCGDQILSNDVPNNFACTPLVDYDFNTRLYDPILDAVWHMFNAVHAYCFKYFQINTRLWHKYSMIIANAFTHGMRQRWKASTAVPKFYMRLLGPDHEVHLETINRCMFSTVLRSDVPAIMPRFDTLSPITFGKERMIHKDAAAANPKP